MRLFISSLAVAALFCALVAGCNVDARKNQGSGAATVAATPPPTLAQAKPEGDGATRITVTDLRAALDKGTAVVVDVRNDDQYNAGHIKGAVHIPEMDIATRSDQLPRDKTIVTYCS